MTVARDLVEAEWRARRRSYVVLALLLTATAGTLFLVLSAVDGLQEGLGSELSDTLGSDVRLTRGRTGLGDGEIMRDLRDVEAGIAFASPDARFAPRLETQAILLHGADFTTSVESTEESRSAAVLVGIDPAVDALVSPLPEYLAGGVPLGRAPALTLPDGEPLVPLYVGKTFLERTNGTLSPGDFSWGAVFNLTTGRVENGRLVTAHGIVVGVYETGFRMIDRLVIYAPRPEVARLLGYFPTDPPANVVLVRGGDAAAIEAHAHRVGLSSIDAPAFRESYLGPAFLAVRLTAWTVLAVLTLMTAGWVAHTLAHHVHSDRRKIATLRAIGIPAVEFSRVYLVLGAALGAVGGVVGAGAGALVAFATRAVLDASGSRFPGPQLRVVDAGFVVALSLGAALLAAQWAIAQARRRSIREALAAPS